MARRRRNLSEKRNEEVKVSCTRIFDFETKLTWFSDGNYQQAAEEASPQNQPQGTGWDGINARRGSSEAKPYFREVGEQQGWSSCLRS